MVASTRTLLMSAAAAVRVRYAPSPTGQMHLGGLRTALFNYLYAKKHNGTFLLRVEDTDQTRFVEGAYESIVGSLKWSGIDFDEGPGKDKGCGPYIQSERLAIYKEHSQKLLDNGWAYPCFCSPERLTRLREAQQKKGLVSIYDRHCQHLKDSAERVAAGEPHVVRLRVPKEEEHVVVNDLIRGAVSFSTKVVDDQVLMKSDGFPTYHLAMAVDDHLMGISHVIRGEEWLSSTPKHILLYRAFGWEAPAFAHLPLLLNPDGTKLSKRTGLASVDDYMTGEYLPEAVMNFVGLLGWNPGGSDTQEIFRLSEMVDKFDLSNVNKSGAIVNIDKLRWINGQHLRARVAEPDSCAALALQLREVLQSAVPDDAKSQEHDAAHSGPLRYSEIKQAPRASDLPYLESVLAAISSRITTLFGVRDMCPYFFVAPNYTSATAVHMKSKVWAGPDSDRAVALVLAGIQDRAGPLTSEDYHEIMNEAAAQLAGADPSTKAKKTASKTVMGALRYVLTATQVGAPMHVTMSTLGRDETTARLRAHAQPR